MTIDNGNTYTTEDAVFGAECLGYAIGLFGWIVTCLVAWSFTGFWAVLGMYILMSILMWILSMLISMLAAWALGAEGLATIGSFVSTTSDTVVGWFTPADKATA